MIEIDDDIELLVEKTSQFLSTLLTDENVMDEVRRNSTLMDRLDDLQSYIDIDEDALEEFEDDLE